MVTAEHAMNVCAYTMSFLFIDMNKVSTIKARKSAIDMKASIISEMSYLNSEILEVIRNRKAIIVNNYIQPLKNELRANMDVTALSDSTSCLAELARQAYLVSSDMDDELLGKKMTDVKDRISRVIDLDNRKSTRIGPMFKSKTNTVIIEGRKELDFYRNKYKELDKSLVECDLILESCDFTDYFAGNMTISTGEQMPAILEESYETIMNELMLKYIQWKGGEVNVYST